MWLGVLPVLLSIFAFGVMSGCHRGSRTPQPGDESLADTTRLRELREAVTREIGTPRCENRAQCGTMPFGAKPCGGPWSYLVYSRATTDTARLAAAVREYTVFQSGLNRRSGLVSDCRFTPRPAVDCVAGICVPDSAGASRQ